MSLKHITIGALVAACIFVAQAQEQEKEQGTNCRGSLGVPSPAISASKARPLMIRTCASATD